MEFSVETSDSRSWLRRLTPWTLAAGVFAGGGYGVYRCATPMWQDYEVVEVGAAANPVVAGSRPLSSTAVKADLKQLFSPSSAAATAPAESRPAAATAARYEEQKSDRYGAPNSATTARYGNAPALPPLSAAAAPLAAAADAPPESSASRYGGASAAPISSPPSMKIAPLNLVADRQASPAVAVSADANPLRSAATRSTPSVGNSEPKAGSLRKDDAAAREAFHAEAQRQAPPLAAAAVAGAAPTLNLATPPANKPEPRIAIPPAALQQPSDATPRTPAPPIAATSPLAPAAAAPLSSRPTALSPSPGLTPTPGLAAADGAGRPGERGLEGLQTPGVTIQKLVPAEIQVGKKCTFALRIANNGTRPAQQVIVRDEAPQGTQLVGTAPKAAITGSVVQWDLGTLSPGEQRTVEMELIPTDEGDLGSVATVSFAAEASAKSRCTRPELALRLSSNPRVMMGQMQMVEVEVSNPGSGPATGVMLLETVPAGVTHESGPALEFEIGTLKPGETRRLELALRADKAGKIDNMMTARGDANLQVDAQCEFEIIAPALQVAVDGPQRRYLERPATYTVSVANPGTAAAKDVQLVSKLPKGLQFVSANNMGEYDPTTHSVYWSLAELPPSERGKVELTALPIEAGEQKLQFATRAQQGLQDATEAKLVVEGLAALAFEVKAKDQMVEVGGATTFEIRVVNQGSKAATNVQIVAVLPGGLRATGAGGDATHAVQADRVVFTPLPQLPPKGEAKFRVDVQGLRAGDQRLRIEVSSDEVREPIVKQESTRVYADE